jgi:uncharacterized protein YjbI with pentapeptide repeats
MDAAIFYQARLMNVRFTGVSAANVSFGGAKLDHCDFNSAILVGAKFGRTEVIQCIFCNADLQDCDFREARVRGGDFSRAVLAGARFGAAQIVMADFRGANLTGARELTSEQLAQSRTDNRTILPNGNRGPYMRNSGAEKPKQMRAG